MSNANTPAPNSTRAIIAAIRAQLPDYLLIDTPYTITYPNTERKYTVLFEYDGNIPAPENDCDGHGLTVDQRWRIDPTDAETIDYHLGLDEDDTSVAAMELRLRYGMMRPLQTEFTPYRYYDVWETLKLAKREQWGVIDYDNDPEAQDKLHAIVDAAYDYLRGWYNNAWHWCTVCVTPLDQDEEPVDEFAQYIGGCEFGYDDKAELDYFAELIEDLARCAWHAERLAATPGQMSLPL